VHNENAGLYFSAVVSLRCCCFSWRRFEMPGAKRRVP